MRKGGGVSERNLIRPLGHTKGISSCTDVGQDLEKKMSSKGWEEQGEEERKVACLKSLFYCEKMGGHKQS